MDKKPLLEVSQRRYMTSRERALKTALIALLRDDGHGHHHNKYANRLEKFDINIIPLSVDPTCTAFISFDEGFIGIGEAFISDKATFNQLNVILRHELAHNLMLHQVRLAQKIPNYNRIGKSASLHDLFNIIMDDEISNTRYTTEDKQTVRRLKLGAQEISGLVTEDHREGWQNLSLTDMVDELEKEISEDTAKLLTVNKLFLPKRTPTGKTIDPIRTSILNAFNAYQDINTESSIPGTLTDFLAGGCWIQIPGLGRRQWSEDFRELAQEINDGAIADNFNDLTVDLTLKQIAKTAINKSITLFTGKNTVTLYTPEEKYIAEEVLKKLRSEYSEWYSKVTDLLSSYNSYVLTTFLDDLL